MDHDGLEAAFDECEKRVREASRTWSEIPRTAHAQEMHRQRDHLLDMLRRGRDLPPEKKEKGMRWLGFAQGVLWTWGVPLDDLKTMNRSNGPARFAGSPKIARMFELGHEILRIAVTLEGDGALDQFDGWAFFFQQAWGTLHQAKKFGSLAALMDQFGREEFWELHMRSRRGKGGSDPWGMEKAR